MPSLGGADAIPSVSSTALPSANPSVTSPDPGMTETPVMKTPQSDVPRRTTKPYWSLCGEIPANPAMTVDALDGARGDIWTIALSGDGSTLGMYDGRTAMVWHIPANFSESNPLWYARTDSFQIDVSPDGTRVAGSWDDAPIGVHYLALLRQRWEEAHGLAASRAQSAVLTEWGCCGG